MTFGRINSDTGAPGWRTAALVPVFLSLALAAVACGGPAERTELAKQILALSGVRGGLVVHVGCGDGRMLAELNLDSPPVFDGMSAAGGRLLLTLAKGGVLCLAAAAKSVLGRE